MRKQILATIGWTILFFICLAAYKYFTGVDNWLIKALEWAVPSGVGYFWGYDSARIN